MSEADHIVERMERGEIPCGYVRGPRSKGPMTQAIQLAPQSTALALSSEQESLIRDMYGNGATETEFQVFLEVCRARRLNPLTRQIYFVQRWDSEKQRNVWAAQVSIDGFRAIAERTGKYDGQDEPEYEYTEKRQLLLARVRVYRKDWSRPAVGVARFDEYCARKKGGDLTHMWATKGHIMIAKCAEALALRKAFPEELSGMYAPEEMDAEDSRPARRGTSAAHAIADNDAPPRTDSPFNALDDQLAKLEELIAKALTYQDVLTIRAELGSKAKPSELNRAIQKALEDERINGDEYKALGKRWLRIDRQAKVKEDRFAPRVEASFIDEPDRDEREPGSDG